MVPAVLFAFVALAQGMSVDLTSGDGCWTTLFDIRDESCTELRAVIHVWMKNAPFSAADSIELMNGMFLHFNHHRPDHHPLGGNILFIRFNVNVQCECSMFIYTLDFNVGHRLFTAEKINYDSIKVWDNDERVAASYNDSTDPGGLAGGASSKCAQFAWSATKQMPAVLQFCPHHQINRTHLLLWKHYKVHNRRTTFDWVTPPLNQLCLYITIIAKHKHSNSLHGKFEFAKIVFINEQTTNKYGNIDSCPSGCEINTHFLFCFILLENIINILFFY